MKKFIALITLVLSLSAFADSILVYETRDYSPMDIEASFGVNKDLGRAWAVMTLTQGSGDSISFWDERVKVEGLSFNAETKEIVLERNGEQVVCGQMYNRRWILDGGRSIRMTPRCSFAIKKEKIEIDNGFEIKKKSITRVYLNVE
ncbi:MAG: hypothetical protein ACJ76H_05695 [Bacteriovoracaceae bacterium]